MCYKETKQLAVMPLKCTPCQFFKGSIVMQPRVICTSTSAIAAKTEAAFVTVRQHCDSSQLDVLTLAKGLWVLHGLYSVSLSANRSWQAATRAKVQVDRLVDASGSSTCSFVCSFLAADSLLCCDSLSVYKDHISRLQSGDTPYYRVDWHL